MIEVFVEYSGQNGQRTTVPGGPFDTRQDAYKALVEFADLHHGGFRALVEAIDAYGFIVEGSGTVRSVTKP
jgi:hypothetical protein